MTTLESVFIKVQDTLNYIQQSKLTIRLDKVTSDLEGILSEMIEARGEPGPATRKILQITSSPTALYALCEDGSVWGYGADATWVEYTGIPVPKEEGT